MIVSGGATMAHVPHRYHLPTALAPDVVRHPSRFRVLVRKHRLIGMVLRELWELEGPGRVRVALSRPCVYGVFSRPVGGLAPRHDRCVGCLRCTTQYPDVVQIVPNPARRRLGDRYVTPDCVDTIVYEARTGRVPVRGAGYRGPFGGSGWDAMWTDMSEIVRPTRDGIHGREYISTAVDIGAKPSFLRFGPDGSPREPRPRTFSLPVPFLFEPPRIPVGAAAVDRICAEAAARIGTLALIPARDLGGLGGVHVAPIVGPGDEAVLDRLPAAPRLVEVCDERLLERVRARWPDALVALRLEMGRDLRPACDRGWRVFHLTADYHGRADGRFALDHIRAAHEALVEAGIREEVTLIGGGGIVMAEHVPKAIICGLDAVALDLALVVALQGVFTGEAAGREAPALAVPHLVGRRLRRRRDLTAWGVQRLQNLAASWRDQLLEVLGAMGLREVRRLRGEMGRAMFQADLEREAFEGIDGYAAAG
ncbi:MAG TPA: hypothetical protein VNI83_13235 [Vicinamibacterales bacterium]|nr:hypothetical protein [Vicinamibacterales bacterium]